MNITGIKSIYKFNQEAGLLDDKIDLKLETSMAIEEALEDFDLSYLAKTLNCGSDTPKAVSRCIASLIVYPEDIPKKKLFDKYLDGIVINMGSIFKLGLLVQDLMNGLNQVAIANMKKVRAGKDESGKLKKPENFEGPEDFLDLIIKNRENQK
jgi:hypothetical protein